MKMILLTILISAQALAGFPPTTTKGVGDTNPVVTFNYGFPNNAVSRTGVTTNLGVLGLAGGGTGAVLSPAAGGMIYSNSSVFGITAAGASGQILTSQGASPPIWTTASAGGSGWSLIGNSGTSSGANFVGTTDGQSLLFKTNNISRVIFDTLGRVGIGNLSPAASLDVSGMVFVTSGASNALAVGPGGFSNPTLQVDSSGVGATTGIAIVASTAGNGTLIQNISSGPNEDLQIAGKGTGQVEIGNSLNNMTTTNTNFTIRVANGSKATITSGSTAWSQSANATAATVRYSWAGATDTSLTANTEAPSTYFNLSNIRSHLTGTIALQRDFRISPSTHASVANGTIQNAAGFAVDGAPIAGTNMNLNRTSTIYSAGSAVGATASASYGLNITANTGATNNYAAALVGGNVGIGTFSPAASLDISGSLKLNGATSGSATFQMPAVSATKTYTLPSSDGTNSQQLTTDGAGNLSWAGTSASGDWTSVTCTASWTTNTTTTCAYKCLDVRNARVNYKMTFTGAPNAAFLAVNMPLIFTPDPTAAPGGAGSYIGGFAQWYGQDSGVQDYTGNGIVSITASASTTNAQMMKAIAGVSITSPWVVGNADSYFIMVDFPVKSCPP